jgi:hypothetical protein
MMPNADSILMRIGVDVGDCGGTLNEQVNLPCKEAGNGLTGVLDSIF